MWWSLRGLFYRGSQPTFGSPTRVLVRSSAQLDMPLNTVQGWLDRLRPARSADLVVENARLVCTNRPPPTKSGPAVNMARPGEGQLRDEGPSDAGPGAPFHQALREAATQTKR